MTTAGRRRARKRTAGVGRTGARFPSAQVLENTRPDDVEDPSDGHPDQAAPAPGIPSSQIPDQQSASALSSVGDWPPITDPHPPGAWSAADHSADAHRPPPFDWTAPRRVPTHDGFPGPASTHETTGAGYAPRHASRHASTADHPPATSGGSPEGRSLAAAGRPAAVDRTVAADHGSTAGHPPADSRASQATARRTSGRHAAPDAPSGTNRPSAVRHGFVAEASSDTSTTGHASATGRGANVVAASSGGVGLAAVGGTGVDASAPRGTEDPLVGDGVVDDGDDAGPIGARFGPYSGRKPKRTRESDTGSTPVVVDEWVAVPDGEPTPEQSAERTAQLIMPWAGALVRPYAHTGGRTRSSHDLAIEALVSTSGPSVDVVIDEVLTTHHRRMIVDMCLRPRSVAEVAALLAVPLGVARVLLGDLAVAGVVVVHPTVGSTGDGAPNLEFMRRVLVGLRRL
ncbi:DUF742 domain-containing protein [Actinophytocola oryzae]|uniref:DUF742 domain-containing protein n=1 Tax=Actinophytocola oryzae TaxID=502181 RepID=UPI001FB9C12F|nr:DUF742 domain-containing protein [Actinophytocola oryzae]